MPMRDFIFPMTFMDIETLAERWRCRLATIQALAETEQIKVCIRPVALEIALEHFEPTTKKRITESISRSHLHRLDIYRLFKNKNSVIPIYLPEWSLNISVDFSDLIVLLDDVENFERKNGLVNYNYVSLELLSDDFTSFLLNGQEYTFGIMQAKVIRLLWQARENGQPWVYGKRMLSDIGSGSERIKSLFSRNPVWRKLIVSDKKGKYKLNLPPKIKSDLSVNG